VTTLERITAILERARIDGGLIEEDVARAVLDALGLDEDGQPIIEPPPDEPPDDAPEPPEAA
jgi:hypothetical protein